MEASDKNIIIVMVHIIALARFTKHPTTKITIKINGYLGRKIYCNDVASFIWELSLILECLTFFTKICNLFASPLK